MLVHEAYSWGLKIKCRKHSIPRPKGRGNEIRESANHRVCDVEIRISLPSPSRAGGRSA